MSDRYEPTNRTKIRRLPNRGEYSKGEIHAILDEAFVCNLAFAVDGRPIAIPTAYARSGDRLYLHGSAASRTMKALGAGIDVCVTVTLIDGIVIARSAFHHSINYRSVVIFGKATPVLDEARKMEALRCFTNHVVPGRWDEVRAPNEQELKQTIVLELPLEEVSAKIRRGFPIDDEEDYALPVWAGTVPVRVSYGAAIPDDRVLPNAPVFDANRLAK